MFSLGASVYELCLGRELGGLLADRLLQFMFVVICLCVVYCVFE